VLGGEEKLALMIAYAVSGVPVDYLRLPLESLERCGACVLLDRARRVITVPTAVLLLFVQNEQDPDPERFLPMSSAVEAFKDSIMYFLSSAGRPWQLLEVATAAGLAMRLNASALIWQDKARMSLQELFGGAVISPGLGNLRFPVVPVCVIRPHEELLPDSGATVHVGSAEEAEWFSGNFVVMAVPNQRDIDVFCVARNVSDGKDLLILVQCRLVRRGGLQRQVFIDRELFCNGVVAAYTKATGRPARYVLGIVNPVRSMSDHCREFIQDVVGTESRSSNRSPLSPKRKSKKKEAPGSVPTVPTVPVGSPMPCFGVGRLETGDGSDSSKFFGLLASHPFAVPRLFINSRNTTANDLALFLSGSEATAQEVAAVIIKERPDNGYSSWNDVLKVVPTASLDEGCEDLIMFD
jgi:hypothetical protein